MKNLRRLMMVFLAIVLTGMVVFTTPSRVQAAKIVQQGMIEGIIDDDLIVVAKDIVINGTVDGSIIAIGATITLNGRIAGDAFLFGGIVRISQGSPLLLLWILAGQ
jgi:cytoskeletal protein CcmA (bactofilin family)